MRLRFVAILILLIAPCVSAPTAEATGPNHPFLRAITGVKYPSLTKPEPFKDACGVAVDALGRTYIASHYQNKVEIVDDGGTRLAVVLEVEPSVSGKNPIDAPCDLGVDSAGNLYVNNWHRSVVRFPPVPNGTTLKGPGEVIDTGHPTGVTVDPTTGNLYVVARTYVAEYEAPVVAGDDPTRKIGFGTLGDGYGVALSAFPGLPGVPATAGWVYVADVADNTIKVYDPALDSVTPIRTITGAGTPRGSFFLADADLAVDPSDGHLYVTDNLEPGFEHPELAVHEFSSFGNYRGRVPNAVPEGGPTRLVHGEPSGMTIAEGEILVTSGNFDNSEVRVYGPAPPLDTRLLTIDKSGAGSGTVRRAPPGWVRCGTACVGELDHQSSAVLRADPDPHSRFVEWTGCKELIGDGCVVTMSTDVTVNAEFEPIPPQTLAVSLTGTGSGSVLSAPAGIECGSSCAAEFDEGSTVTLTAAADTGSRLTVWSGCDAAPAPSTCVVTMNATRSVEARFEPVPQAPPPSPEPRLRMLTVSSTAVGDATGTVLSTPAGIACGVVCAHVYQEGSAITLVANPAPGSSFLGWGGCDDPAGPRCVLRLGTDRSVVAAFTPGRPGPLRLRRLHVRGTGATLTLVVPVAGTLTARSGKLRPTSALPLRAGQVKLNLRLSRAGLHALRRAETGTLRVRVALSLTPFDGGEEARMTKTIVFRGG